MKDPRPLLLDDPSLAERLLLSSAVLDRPPPGGKARALVALGLGASVGTAATPSSAAAGAPLPALVGKWLATGALSGLVVASSVAVVAHRLVAPARPAMSTVAPARATAPASLAPTQAVSRSSSPEASPALELGATGAPARSFAGEATANSVRTAPRGTHAVRPAPVQSLSAEIAALDAARRALAAGDAAHALGLLQTHDVDFPVATLSQEATVLRVEALHALGRDPEAALAAKQLLATDPHSAHAKRIRSILATLPKEP